MKKGVKFQNKLLSGIYLYFQLFFEYLRFGLVSSKGINTCHKFVVRWKSKNQKMIRADVTIDAL